VSPVSITDDISRFENRPENITETTEDNITKNKITIKNQEEPEKAFLVAVDTRHNDTWSVKSSVDELEQLARSAGADVVGRMVQKLRKPLKTQYIGTGKLDELANLKSEKQFNTVIFDDELSPLQQLTLEKELKVKVIDRAALILDIFAKRAKTREGQLQVELAQLQYLLPRLSGQWGDPDRMGAGIGTRGPGESKLEVDRRAVEHRIQTIKKRLEEVSRHRTLYRERRKRTGIPVVSLVGYTNAGKSTLMNALTRSDVLTRNQLFSTLDPTTRRLHLSDTETVLLTDTVGFIQKLPPAIIAAFRATLEELSEADVLIHVVDLTSHNAAEQCETVEDILGELGLKEKPRLTALNKIDLMLDKSQLWDEEKALKYLAEKADSADENTMLVSAVKGWGLSKLKEKISAVLREKNISVPVESVEDNAV
jgi:GTP-binding protein HflX